MKRIRLDPAPERAMAESRRIWTRKAHARSIRKEGVAHRDTTKAEKEAAARRLLGV